MGRKEVFRSHTIKSWTGDGKRGGGEGETERI